MKAVFPYIRPFLIYVIIYILYLIIDSIEGQAQMHGPSLSLIFLFFSLPIAAMACCAYNLLTIIMEKTIFNLYGLSIHALVVIYFFYSI